MAAPAIATEAIISIQLSRAQTFKARASSFQIYIDCVDISQLVMCRNSARKNFGNLLSEDDRARDPPQRLLSKPLVFRSAVTFYISYLFIKVFLQAERRFGVEPRTLSFWENFSSSRIGCSSISTRDTFCCQLTLQRIFCTCRKFAQGPESVDRTSNSSTNGFTAAWRYCPALERAEESAAGCD